MKREKKYFCKKFFILVLSFSIVFSPLDFIKKNYLYAESNDDVIYQEENINDDFERFLEVREEPNRDKETINQELDLSREIELSKDYKLEEDKLEDLLERSQSRNFDENYDFEDDSLKSTDENQVNSIEDTGDNPIRVQARSSETDDDSKNAYIGKSNDDRDAAKKTLSIVRVVDEENKKISWTVTINTKDGAWTSGAAVYLWLPKQKNFEDFKTTFIKITYKNLGPYFKEDYASSSLKKYDNTPENLSFVDKKSELRSDVGEQPENLVLNSELDYLIDNEAVIDNILEDNNISLVIKGRYITYTFKTTHAKNVNLDNIPLGVTIKSNDNIYRRTLISGAFGMDYRNDIQKPDEVIYVGDVSSLTPDEKIKVKNRVYEQTKAFYENNNMSRELAELEEAKNGTQASENSYMTISNNGAVTISWKDGTTSELNNVSEYIKKDEQAPVITIDPENVTELEKKDILINISAKDHEGNLLAEGISLEGDLPDGLTFTKNEGDASKGVISGKANIVWDDGENERTYRLEIKASDSSEHIQTKVLNITIKKDISLIPVGVKVEGYSGAFMLILFGFSVSILILKKNIFGGLEGIDK